jgi:hypothetical protein
VFSTQLGDSKKQLFGKARRREQMCIATRIVFAAAVAMALVTSANAGPYSTNFESFNLGLVDGQYGWINDNVGDSAIPPEIVNDPTSGGHGKVLRIDPPTDELDYAWSGAFRACDNLVAEGATKFELSWDQWRTGFADILWIVENPDLTGWQAQEDKGSIYPISTDLLPSAPLTSQQWQNIRLAFDVQAKTLEGFLNNVSFGMATGKNFTKFRGMDFQVMVTWGGVAGPNYIDNVSLTVIPEPATIWLLLGALATVVGWHRCRKAA